jgi:large subunit ribosomal protein L24
MRIREGDEVAIIGGKDSGKTGRVVRTEPKRSFVYVDKEGPIHVSNVMLLDPKDNKPTRVGIRRDKGGKRERYSKRSGAAF